MPKFDTSNVGGAGATAAVGGTLGALPFLNVLAPGITAAIGSANEDEVNRRRLMNAGRIETPTYENANDLALGYSGDFTPEMLQDPQMAQAVLASDSAEGRAAQLAALAEMAKWTDQSVGSQSALGRHNAEMDARQLAASREGAIRQDAMRRGQVGGAADMIARQQAAQAAANQNLNAGLQNANLAALQALAGSQAQGALAGQLRGQDQNLALANAGIQNQFELFNVGNTNQTNNANTGLMNAAQLRNLDARQKSSDNATRFKLEGRQFNNAGRSQAFQDQMAKYGAIDRAMTGEKDSNRNAVEAGNKAGAQGWSNFKDLAKMMGGGIG